MDEFREHPFLLSYQIGCNLAVNAIADAWLVVDGPNCVLFRTTQIQGNHDWGSDLMRSSGLHRVADTDCTPDRAALGDARILEDRLQAIDALDECELILLGAMAPVAITGRQYDRIVRRLEPPLRTPLVHLASGSLTGDWLDGYGQTLAALARQLPLTGLRTGDRDAVGVIGYLMDRNEGDHRANLAELARLVQAAGGRYAGAWLSGGTRRDLQRAAAAGTLVSLPYGRAAARELAARTGARLVECRLPVGLEGTSRFVRALAEALGHQRRAEAWLEGQLGDAARKLEWILPKRLFGKRLVVIADPHLGAAVTGALTELGCRVPLRIYWSTETHVEPAERSGADPLLVNPQAADVLTAMRIMNQEPHPPDLLLTNSQALTLLRKVPGPDVPWVEIGFPSFHSHALFDAPWLGLTGVLGLVDRVANALARAQVPVPAADLDSRPEPV